MDNNMRLLAGQLREPSGTMGSEVAEMMKESNANMIWQTINLLSLEENDAVLEIGPGSGFHIPELFSKAKIKNYHGLEISELMLNTATASNLEYVKNALAEFRLYDGEHIPYPDEFFQKIFTVNTLYFWKQPEAFLKELKRVLHLSGLLIICFAERAFMEQLPFTQYGFSLYTAEEVKALAKSSGLLVNFIEQFVEEIISKSGETVNRKFVCMGFTIEN